MTVRKFTLEIEGLFKASGEIDIDDSVVNTSALSTIAAPSTPTPEHKQEREPYKPTPIPEDAISIHEYGVEPIDSQIEGLTFQGCCYPGHSTPMGDGYWIEQNNGVRIIKIKNGVKTSELARSYIGTPEFNNLDLSNVNLYIPKGTYIHLQGAGMNALWYQKTKSISGEGTLIGIKNDNNPSFNKISTKVQGITLKNIIVECTPDRHADQILHGLTINLNSLEKSRNPITVDSLKATIEADGVVIETEAQLRSGFYIDHAKKVSIKNSSIVASYADNGIRVSRVLETCELIGNTSGKGFNTALQASANREALSIGFKFHGNTVNEVLEEGAGFDSYANSLNLLPVITKFYISKAYRGDSGTVIEIDTLYFIEELIAGKKYGNKTVNAAFVGDAKNFLLVIDGEYKDFRVISSEPYNNGNSLKIVIESDYIPSVGSEASLVTGFYKCSISENTVNGVVPKTNQPGHALSLWGGGFHNIIARNVVRGGRSGLNMASLGAFGVENPDYFCHAIGNIIEENKIYDTISAIRITSEYSKRFGYGNKLLKNEVSGGEIYINNQRDFTMRGNKLSSNTVMIENVSGILEGGVLTDTLIEIKNCPDLVVGSIDLVGKSEIRRV